MTYKTKELVANENGEVTCLGAYEIGGPREVLDLILDLIEVHRRVRGDNPLQPSVAGGFKSLVSASQFRDNVREVLRQFDAGEVTLARVADVIRECE